MTSVNGYLVAQDGADRWLWDYMLEVDPDLCDLQESSERAMPGAASLLWDVFCALFKAKPVLGEPRTENQRERYRLLSELMETHEYLELRVTTRLRQFESVAAAKKLICRLVEAWRQLRREGAASVPAEWATDAVASLIRRLLRDTQEAVSEQQAFVQTWGTDPGQASPLELSEALFLAERVSESVLLQRIAKLAGRLKALALRQHAVRVRRGCDELVDVEQGNDLARVLPSEFVSLRNPNLRSIFFRKFAEGALLQYRLSGRETLGEGPVVICLDSSGSMKGDREAWAKAVALALLTVARKEQRDCALVHFGSNSECRTFRFERGAGGHHDVLEALSFAFHGGTDFERPLREAIEILAESPFQNADVVFLTDGCCEVGQEFLADLQQIKAATQVRIFSVLIDPTGSLSDASLQAFSNEVSLLRDFSQDQAVLDGLFGR